MAARVARASFARCVQINSHKCRISRSFSASHLLLVRGTNQRTAHNLDLETEAAADDDFFGVASERDVVTVPGSESFTRDRLEKFEHLARSRDARVSDVKVIDAGFGTIRYDSDNQPRYHGQYEDDTLLDDVHLDSFGSGKSANRISKPKLGVRESEAKADRNVDASETKADRDVDASEVVSTVTGSREIKGSRVLKQGLMSNPGKYSTTSASGAIRDCQDADKTQPNERPELPTAQVEPRQKIQRKKVCRDVKQPSSVEKQHTTESSKTASNEHHPSVSELRCDAEETEERGVVLDSRKDAQALQRRGLYESSNVGALPLQNKTVNHPPGTRATVTTAHPLTREEALLGKLSKAQQALIGRDNKIAKDNESQSRIDTELGDAEAPSIAPHSLQKFTKRDRSEKIVTERPGNRSRAGSIAPNHLEGADDSQPPDSEEQQTAYDYLRRESPPSSVKLDSKGFRILKSEIRPDLSRLLHSEAVNLLQKRVLYNDNDILVLNKPYGMLCHGPAPEVSDACVLTKLLPDLSSALYPRQDAKLYTVHRLDRDVTGVLLLARTQRMADTLNSLFQKHRVSKTYLAITAGVPDHLEGVIDMPLAEGEVDGARRMVLNPKLDPEFQRLVPKFRKSFAAVTMYRVLASCGRAGYLELRPTTGVKHQLRAHLGLGLRCPILGDHKYSHLRRLAPQKLPGDMLDRLGIRQSKVRDAPLHLHARAVVVPEILDGRNLTVAAEVPYHFAKNLRRLKLNRN